MTAEQLYQKITALTETAETRDLEDYLRALLNLVQTNKENELTDGMMLRLLRLAFTAEAAPFRDEWLKYDTAPDQNRISRKLTNPEFSAAVDKSNTSELAPLDFTLAVLKFQIAELRKMRGKQLVNKYRFCGIASETGHSWYNFSPAANLRCGARCMLDNELELERLDWSFLGELLENGRIYE